MVKAELSYNPFMLETEIKFNEQPPRINSLVEKYQEGMLQDWIRLLPGIYYDEMNGYDFELEFSGTERDFSELKKAFRQARVSDEQVKLFHKTVLESRSDKSQRIDELLDWLMSNTNRHFNNDTFRRDNATVFDGAYPLILIQEEQTELPVIDWTDASVEIISNVRELDNTDLKYTPIIIAADSNKISEISQTIKYLKRKGGVTEQQLFFIVDHEINQETIYRLLKDLGINTPHIIQSYDDELLKKYFEIYPETNYIQTAIRLFIDITDEIGQVLKVEQEQGVKANSKIIEKIQKIDDEIKLAADADDEITTKDNLDKPAAFTIAKNRINYKLREWRKKKTKVVTLEEATILANELHHETEKALAIFVDSIDQSVIETKDLIDQQLLSMYVSSGCNDNYIVNQLELKNTVPMDLPNLSEELLELKVEEKVLKDTMGLFYIHTKSETEYVNQTAYYLQKWREHVFLIIEEITEQYMEDSLKALSDYNDCALKMYHDHLQQKINEMRNEKRSFSELLSSEERQLQQDAAWLENFRQQIKSIARG